MHDIYKFRIIFNDSGLDTLHNMTNDGRTYKLRVDMLTGDGRRGYAVYDKFSVAGSKDKYRLTLGSYSGTAGCCSIILFVQISMFKEKKLVCQTLAYYLFTYVCC